MALRAAAASFYRGVQVYKARPFAVRGMATAADVEKALKDKLKASDVVRSHLPGISLIYSISQA